MKKILLMAFTATVMLGACKKSDDSSKEELCTTISSYSGLFGNPNASSSNASFNLTYDSQGRLVSESGSGRNQVLTYETSTIKVKTTEENVTSNDTYTLDGNNRIIKSEGDGLTGNRTYKYDSNGYLSEIENEQGGTTKYTWSNGNLLKREGFDTGSSVAYETTTYSYYDDIATQVSLVIEQSESMNPLVFNYYGKTSKNLLKSENNTSYKYDKDTKGRVTKVTISGIELGSSGQTYSDSYSINYSCD